MSSIRLHPKKGLNPHLTYCPRCGGDSESIVLLGATETKYECGGCGQWQIGSNRGKCISCGSTWLENMGKVEENEKIACMCKACEEELKSFNAELKKGGVYFKCKCGAHGMVKGDTELAKAVREHAKINIPDPVGVELDECPQCSKADGKSDAE